MGKLVLYYATMNSGKSLELIRTDYNYMEKGFNTIVMKPEIDIKANDYIISRAGDLKRKVDFLIGNDDKILEILKNNVDDVKCIFIDEAQFLNERQVKELRLLTAATDISVICYALRLNFKGELFEGSKALLTDADKLIELKTLCECGNIARYVGRKVNGKYVCEGNVVVIDGENDNVEYNSLCEKCFLEKVKKDNLNKVRRLVYGK